MALLRIRTPEGDQGMKKTDRYLRYLAAERASSRMYRTLATMTDGDRREALLELAAI